MSDITNWKNNTYVLLSDLHDDHEVALVENSLRDSEFYDGDFNLIEYRRNEVQMGVFGGDIGTWLWSPECKATKLTRTQALKLAGVEL